MSRKQREFTRPLGTGRSTMLGASDPRIRRDGARRVESVPSGATPEDIAALASEVASLRRENAELRGRIAAIEGTNIAGIDGGTS